jgi:hypothetical protein
VVSNDPQFVAEGVDEFDGRVRAGASGAVAGYLRLVFEIGVPATVDDARRVLQVLRGGGVVDGESQRAADDGYAVVAEDQGVP